MAAVMGRRGLPVSRLIVAALAAGLMVVGPGPGAQALQGPPGLPVPTPSLPPLPPTPPVTLPSPPPLDGWNDYEALAAGGGQGGFAWPVAPRTRPPVTQPFGCTDVAGEPYSATCATHRVHTGVDLGVPTGTPVLASKAGVARTFRSASGYGWYVLLVHGDGVYTLYAHLSRILVSDGQVVGRGQEIGRSGSTGFSTGPHLHFEVRRGQGFVGPCPYLGC
jgi:murein DD-endopeptidase MepM/ murein hydrolase activator NlpD